LPFCLFLFSLVNSIVLLTNCKDWFQIKREFGACFFLIDTFGGLNLCFVTSHWMCTTRRRPLRFPHRMCSAKGPPECQAEKRTLDLPNGRQTRLPLSYASSQIYHPRVYLSFRIVVIRAFARREDPDLPNQQRPSKLLLQPRPLWLLLQPRPLWHLLQHRPLWFHPCSNLHSSCSGLSTR